MGYDGGYALHRAACAAARNSRLVGGTAGRDRDQGFDGRRGAPVEAGPGADVDGIHDLGGKQGFGRVRHSLVAQAFHEPRERRAFALNSLAVKLGIYNMDEYRHAIERMEPRHYMSASYYERTLTSLATLCVEKGIVTLEELERSAKGSFPLSLPSAAGRSNSADRQRFNIGDRVRVRVEYVAGHARMPAYIRGKRGVVVSESPAYPFPDAHAHGVGQPPSRPTTFVSARPNSGQTRPIKHSSMWLFSKAIWNRWHRSGRSAQGAVGPGADPIRTARSDADLRIGLVLADVGPRVGSKYSNQRAACPWPSRQRIAGSASTRRAATRPGRAGTHVALEARRPPARSRPTGRPRAPHTRAACEPAARARQTG